MKRIWTISAAIFLILLCSPLVLAPFVYNSLYPQLEVYNDTILIEQQYEIDSSWEFCRVTLFQKQFLQTTASRDEIWNRMPEEWSKGGNIYGAFFDQVRYEDGVGEFYKIGSWINYDSSSPGRKPIFIRNKLTIQLCFP